MRKTKRRVFRSKRRVLRSKRSVLRIKTRRMQRKFKYQRGGETEEELKSKVDVAIQKVETKEHEHAQENSNYNEKDQKFRDNLEQIQTLRLKLNEAKNPPKKSALDMFKKKNIITPDMITQLEQNLAQAQADDMNLRIAISNINRNINRLKSEIFNEKKQAMPLLENFVRTFPENTYRDNYTLQKKKYSDDIAEQEKRRQELDKINYVGNW